METRDPLRRARPDEPTLLSIDLSYVLLRRPSLEALVAGSLNLLRSPPCLSRSNDLESSEDRPTSYL